MVKKCLVRGCKAKILIRGVCRNHYHQTYRAIKVGRIKSWAEAGRKGLALAEKGRPGPKVSA